MPSVTRRAAPRNRSSHSNVEDQLLAAVEQLASQGHSFTAVSIEQLAKQAGVSRATFYLHFDSKGDLVARLLKRIEDEILSSIAVWYEKAADIDHAQVRDTTARFLRVLRRHNALLTAVHETAAYDPDVRQRLDGVLGQMVPRSQKTMKDVRAAGRANPAASILVVDLLSWFTYHGGLAFTRGASDARLRQLAEGFAHIFEAALFASPRTGTPEKADAAQPASLSTACAPRDCR